MKIYDPKRKELLKGVILYLTPDEASELADTAKQLAEDPSEHHGHVSNTEYSSEITIAVYTRDNLDAFDAASRELLKDEVKS